jgi:DNA-binding CsgD family transcriptional regulator
MEVLQLPAIGKSNSELATHLYVGEGTIKTHVSNVLTKLGLRDRMQAVVFAYESGIVEPGRPEITVTLVGVGLVAALAGFFLATVDTADRLVPG